ncbi:restriction endonuclease [Ectothiorhodospiraceae bacterium 2226]|nr:restriction endonuclease [Ectothiorhodospiraceae bacterium 2226]
MGKRREPTTEEGSEAPTWFPWWVYLLLAPAAYFGLDSFTSPSALPALPALGDAASPLLTGLTALQYAIPALCLLAAGVAIRTRLLRRSAVAADELASLVGIERPQFETLAREWFRRQGLTERGLGQREVCLVLTADGRLRVVQCKAWQAGIVDADVVRELFDVMAAQRADGGYVVTTGRFTGEARHYASGKHIGLIDGAQLLKMAPAAPGSAGASAATATPAA